MNKEILLVNVRVKKEHQKADWTEPPLGLYCLQSIAPEKIGVADIQHNHEIISRYKSDYPNIRVIIVKPDIYQESSLELLLTKIKKLWPGVLTGIASPKNSRSLTNADFYVRSTGRSALIRILRGENPSGLEMETEAKQLELLPTPVSDIESEFTYETCLEKSLGEQTIDIYRPWLGFMEKTNAPASDPGSVWLNSMISWLTKNGYRCFHFYPLSIDSLELIKCLSRVQKVKIAIGFNISDLDTDWLIHLKNVEQLWLYHPQCKDASQALKKLHSAKKCGSKACLELNSALDDINNDLKCALLRMPDRISFCRESDWKQETVRKVYKSHWTFSNFCRSLLNIRNLGELIVFIKLFNEALNTLTLKTNTKIAGKIK